MSPAIRMLVLLLLLGTAAAEFSVKMPYLNPAGVTYTSHLAAYGPLAFRSYAAAPLAAPLAAAPLAAAPLPLAAAPASAVVPVTKFSAQPAVVQNIVDVAHPKVATRRYQIRRPAIKKEFYDIEERIVVRPAGSAVVELEQPISANQRGPTEVRPALPVAQPLLRYAGGHKVHVTTPIFASGYLPTIPHVPAVHEPSAEIEAFEHQQQIISQPLPPQPLPPQPQPPQTLPPQPLPPQPQPPQNLQPQPLPPQPQPFPQQEEQPQLDASDSVAIDNPELARIGGQQSINIQEPLFRSQLQREPQPQFFERSQQQPPQAQLFVRSQQQQQLPPQPQFFEGSQQLPPQPQFFERSQQQPPQPQFFERSQQQPQLPPQPQFFESSQQQPQLPPQPQFFERSQQQPQFPPQQQFLGRLQLGPSPQPQPLPSQPPQFLGRTRLEEVDSVAVPAVQPDVPLFRSQRPLLTPRPEISPRQGPTGPTPLPALRSGLEEVSSARHLSPEQTDLNQRRLIELLTARGPVSEVRSGDGPVRARVISATPAPLNAAPTDAQTNTRRVVVNKPIQTVQEVEVSEPFTKLERVAVHQPAVVKTAHVELAHVPAVTAVPAVHTAVPAAVTPVPFAASYFK